MNSAEPVSAENGLTKSPSFVKILVQTGVLESFK